MIRRLSLALLLVGLTAATAVAIPGRETSVKPLQVRVMDGNGHKLHVFPFDRHATPDGVAWDFGDRYRYNCAWTELFDGSEVLLAEMFMERYGPDLYVRIIDAGGEELREANETGVSPVKSCLGAGTGVSPVDQQEPVTTAGVTFTIARDGIPIRTVSLPAVSPYDDEVTFSLGNAPGEAIMFYDGQAVTRVTIVPRAPGVTVTP